MKPTHESIFWQRRRFLRWSAAMGASLAFNRILYARENALPLTPEERARFQQRAHPAAYSGQGLTPTPLDALTHYNNFYEFGYDKGDAAAGASRLQPTTDWTVEIAGAVQAPQTLTLAEILRRFPLETRVYRMRCVEAWSLVVPWVGFPLAALLALVRPTADARYVAFESRYDPEQFPMQGRAGFGIDFPYREGLRLDEARHPLTLLAVGVYGQALPAQNGAPIRLVVPWKYGFKSLKSLAKITLTRDEPPTTWSRQAPQEYGFYANVNPEVDHPRWSQKNERIIGSGWWVHRKPTLMFNGYGKEVAALYRGMDLRTYF